MCSIALRARLRSACASRSGSARSDPGRHRAELELAVGGQAEAVPQVLDERLQLDRLGPQEVCLLRLREQQQIVDEPCHASDLGLDEVLDPPHVARRRIRLGGEHLELPANDRDRRPQLVRGVGDELALALELAGQAVEHVVERVGEHLDLAGPLGRHVSIRGSSSPASTRVATEAMRRSGADTLAPAK